MNKKIRPRINNSEYISVIYVNNGEDIYTLLNCRLGLYEDNLSIFFDNLVEGIKTNDFFNKKFSSASIALNHTKRHMSEVEESLGKEIKFEYDKKIYKISNNFMPRSYILAISNPNTISAKDLIDELICFYEFISFILGQYYEINDIRFPSNKADIVYYPNFNSKYNVKKKDMFTNQILVNLNDNDIKNLYHNWIEMRRKTHSIFDLYFAALAEVQFEDISLSFMINILEGYSKVMHNSKIKELRKYNKKPRKKFAELNVVLDKFYFNNEYSNLILTREEKEKYKTDYKLVEHRNYFSHLDEIKERYYGQECEIKFNKLNLIFRLQILQDLGAKFNFNMLKKNIQAINRVKEKFLC